LKRSNLKKKGPAKQKDALLGKAATTEKTNVAKEALARSEKRDAARQRSSNIEEGGEMTLLKKGGNPAC